MKKGISILITSTDSRISRHIFLSKTMVITTFFILGIIIILLIVGIISYGSLSYRAVELVMLKKGNEKIEREFNKLEEVKRHLKTTEETNQKIRIMLGIEKTPPVVEPQGGDFLKSQELKSDSLKGGEYIPHLLPAIGQISGFFSPEHNGIDIAAPIFSPVVAAASGKVTNTGWDTLYGNYIIIEHGPNYSTFYGHLNSIQVQNSQSVIAGEVIGTVGSSGKSSSPHLHYEVRLMGVPVDPLPYLPISSHR